MKKLLLTLTLVSGAFFAQAAADTYLYWMLDETPTKGTPMGATYEDYYARVKIVGSDTYLNFCEGGANAGDTLYAEGSEIPYQMLLTGTDYSNKSFIIELWNDDALNANTEASFRKTLAWSDVSKYITTGSEGHITPGTMEVGSFSAVPEPTSGMMLLVGAMLLGLKRKKLA